MASASNIPFTQASLQAQELINKGATVFQKFTCAECGSRQTIEEPNTFYTKGQCEECKHITDLMVRGCGYMLHMVRNDYCGND